MGCHRTLVLHVGKETVRFFLPHETLEQCEHCGHKQVCLTVELVADDIVVKGEKIARVSVEVL